MDTADVASVPSCRLFKQSATRATGSEMCFSVEFEALIAFDLGISGRFPPFSILRCWSLGVDPRSALDDVDAESTAKIGRKVCQKFHGFSGIFGIFEGYFRIFSIFGGNCKMLKGFLKDFRQFGREFQDFDRNFGIKKKIFERFSVFLKDFQEI